MAVERFNASVEALGSRVEAAAQSEAALWGWPGRTLEDSGGQWKITSDWAAPEAVEKVWARLSSLRLPDVPTCSRCGAL